MNIQENAGRYFANTLRALLKQDPDVIMIGEIRDQETAEIATKAAQTGHLVLSTLHTTDACAAISRLMNLGVSAYNLASTLKMITAQPLLRRLCPHCQTTAPPEHHALKENPLNMPILSAIHCVHCHHQGYQGRIVFHQILTISTHIQDLISQHQPIHSIRQVAFDEGMKSLETLALEKIQQRLTSIEEAQRVLGSQIHMMHA